MNKGFEAPDLDYKLEFDNSTRAWMEIAKDIFGMSNYGGGYIVIGVENLTFNPIGVEVSFTKDVQEWVDRVSKWATGKIVLSYFEHIKEIDGEKRKFPIIHVHGSIGSFIIPKIEGKYYLESGEEKTAFKQGILYIRRVTSSVAALGNEYWEFFWSLLRRTAARNGSTSVPLDVVSVLNQKAEPDIVEETLWFNLFPVTEIPDLIYVVDTEFRYPQDLYDHIQRKTAFQKEAQIIPPFMLENKKIYTFSPIDEKNILRLCRTFKKGNLIDDQDSAMVTTIQTSEWIDDQTKHQQLVKLLNYNLKELCRRKKFYYDKKRDRYYMRYYGGRIPEITWKPYKKISTRRLVHLKLSKITGNLSYCEHFAGKLRFTRMGKGIYLIIEPFRVLTQDGVNPLDQKRNVKISTKSNFHYHNNNYLYDMKFWLHILAGSRKEIYLGYDEGTISVDVTPINSKVNFGIFNDQHTNEDFLDVLKSEPLEYVIEYKDDEENNPVTETSLEE